MDSLFFWTSKLTWLVVAPDSLLPILMLVTWALLWRGAYRASQWLMGFLAVVLLMVAFLPVGEWLLYPLESRFSANPDLPEKVDGIIILSGAEDPVGSAVWNQAEMMDGAERDLAFLELARRYPDAKLVFTGGTGSMVHQEYKAADVAKMLFEQQGLDLGRVVFEKDSRNTYENAMFSMAVLKPVAGERWVLITTAFHMPRSIGIFCKAGWPMIPYPVDHRTRPGNFLRVDLDLSGHLYDLKTGLREWLGLLAYYATGKTTALLPNRCD